MIKFVLFSLILLVGNENAQSSSTVVCDDIVVPGSCRGELIVHDPTGQTPPVSTLFCILSSPVGNQPSCPPGCVRTGTSTTSCTEFAASCSKTYHCVPRWITELPF